MASLHVATSIERFDGADFFSWSHKMKAVLLREDLWEVVEDHEADRPAVVDPSTPASGARSRAWKKRQDKAVGMIYLHVSAGCKLCSEHA